MATGKQVRLFLVDGSPTGILTAEIMNWTGRVVSGSRSELNDLLGRGEANSPGVYFLLGDNPEDADRGLLYVGEADDVAARLRQHNSASTGKEFWNRVVFLTSKDANLTKAHVRYLESRFIALAAATDRYALENGNRPPTVNLPEADVSDMEYFISQAQIVLPVLGLDAFRGRPIPTTATTNSTGDHLSPVFEMKVPAEQGIARGQDINGEFVVVAGSSARSTWTGSGHNYGLLYERLRKAGTLSVVDGEGVFVDSYAFNSPSAAAAVVSGRNANGRTAWKVPSSGLTFAQWQEQLAPPLPEYS
ncbi:GIY-YIG nuclease family protein [Arthrobacter wenxiniae]|uniref:GIY-YIG nuclease family protein n=1 Tax=Arthrobacter wenxiniae TaxID=2713570 RepID=A0A7Y7IJ31_9MICC|nr:GIY-YIG nuclease family protein [Arthrobacter wenxiniae]NVM96177.1 GIY-YIG nuclease family protein [Arthrobacter wenxiniae]